MDGKITQGNRSARAGNGNAPPLTAGLWPDDYLGPDTRTLLTAVTDHLNAGELSRGQVRDLLRAKLVSGAAIAHLGNASFEVGRWLALSDATHGGFRISVGVDSSRVLVEFTDGGERIPDPYRSRTDAAMAYAVLAPYVVGWGWQVSEGTRAVRIYGDLKSPAAPGNGGYFE